MVTRRSAALGAMVVLGALVVLGPLVAGCGANPPSPSPSVRPSSAATPTPSLAPGVTATPATSPTPDASDESVLPTPETTDVVLLVNNPAALTERESVWLADLRADLGKVDALAYSGATLEALTRYFTVFVIDTSSELDVTVLAEAYGAGLTVHLVGPAAAAYQAQVTGGAP